MKHIAISINMLCSERADVKAIIAYVRQQLERSAIIDEGHTIKSISGYVRGARRKRRKRNSPLVY